MNLESLRLLRTILASQTLTVGQDDFLIIGEQAARALAELDAEIAAQQREPSEQ